MSGILRRYASFLLLRGRGVPIFPVLLHKLALCILVVLLMSLLLVDIQLFDLFLVDVLPHENFLVGFKALDIHNSVLALR